MVITPAINAEAMRQCVRDLKSGMLHENNDKPRPQATPLTVSDEVKTIDDIACVCCGQHDHEAQLLLCDGCDDAWHFTCLPDALAETPEGDWFCPECDNPDGQ